MVITQDTATGGWFGFVVKEEGGIEVTHLFATVEALNAALANDEAGL